MKDYYKILGVEEEASEEEIRARWIELTKYYHPDLGKTEEGDEKIREINEAYEILKNESTRFSYDFERDLKRSFIKKAHRQQVRRMNIRKIVIVPSGILVLCLIVGFFVFKPAEVAPPLRTGAKTEALYKSDRGSEKKTASQIPPVKTDSKPQEESKAPKEIKKEVMPPESEKTVSLSPRRSPSSVERESERKKEPPRKILPESKVPVKVEKEAPKVLREGTPQERTRIASAPVLPPAKKELETRKKATPQVVLKSEMPAMKKVSKEVPKEVPKEIPKEVTKEVPKEIPKEVPKEVSKEVPKEMPKQVAREIPNETPKETAKQIAKEIPKEVPKEVPKEAPKEVAREAPREVPKEVRKEVAKEVPKEIPKEVPKEVARVTLHPGEKLTMWTKGEKTVSSRPSLLAREEEVKQFFSNYVDRYNRKDVDGFLSFFSSKAIQNQTEGLEAIGNLYNKSIDQSEKLRYQIEGMKIEIYQHRVDVKARFRVDQKLKKDGEEKVWKGNIRWVLVKEEGRLKISSLDYQNEKSP
jgi:curved DNA-binding protein CbpA/ketosteroid isomerase-like protein